MLYGIVCIAVAVVVVVGSMSIYCKFNFSNNSEIRVTVVTVWSGAGRELCGGWAEQGGAGRELVGSCAEQGGT